MRARQSSQLRLLLPTTSLLNKLPPLKVEMAVTGVLEVAIPSGVLLVGAVILSGVLLVGAAIPSGMPPAGAAILSGVLLVEAAILSGVLLPPPPPRMPKNLPSGLNAVPGTVRRKKQTTH